MSDEIVFRWQDFTNILVSLSRVFLAYPSSMVRVQGFIKLTPLS